MILKRFLQTDNFTAGTIEFNGEIYYTLERPWLKNASNVSCVPHGLYEVVPYSSAKYPDAYHIKNVLDRTHILIHSGNFVRHTQGCVLIGKGFNIDKGEAMVTSSRDAMDELREYIGENAFKLEIRDV